MTVRIWFFLFFFALSVRGFSDISEVIDSEEFNLLAEAVLEHPTRLDGVAQNTPEGALPEATFPTAPTYNTFERSCPGGRSDNGFTINFEDICVIELIRFISQISNMNFIFDSKDVDFKISIVSEDPTSVNNLMAALLQVLQMNNLSVVEQGNNILIYNNFNGRQHAIYLLQQA